jgi:TrpR-related protein YerC/YecD
MTMTSGKVVPADANPETATRFDELVEAFARLRNVDVVAAFMRDLCTSTELDAMGQRLQVARLVDEGVPYQEISRRTGASTATVTRVAQWLHHGEGGYRVVLKQSRR